MGVPDLADDPVASELQALGVRVGELIDALENHPDATVGGRVEELLQALDTMHRTALSKLTGLLAHHDLLGHACADPVLAMVLDIYDLAPEQTPGAAPRGASPGAKPSGSTPPFRLTEAAPAPSTHDHASPTASGLIKLDQVVRFTAASPAPATSPGRAPTVAPAAVAAAPSPAEEPAEWTQLFHPDDVPREGMAASADATVLICNISGVLHALQNRCGGSPLPLHFGEVVSGRVMCPWHKGCAYDVATGESTTGRRTIVYPLKVDGGAIHVALNRGWSTGPLQPNTRAAPM